MAIKERNANVIAFYNFKGGVGKTTLAVNFAAWQARNPKKRVLFIDMETQCNSDVGFLGFSKDELKGDPANYKSVLNIPGIEIPEQGISIPKLPVNKLIEQAPNFNLFAIKGNYGLDDYWCSDSRLTGRLDILLEAIDELRTLFDYIVMDLGPRDNAPTLNALVAADYVIIPVTCDSQSYEGAERYFEKIYPTCKSINPTLTNLGIVANRYKPSFLNFFSVDFASLADSYDTKLFNFKIRESVALSSLTNWDFIEKAKTGRCVISYDKYIEKNYSGVYQDIMGFVMEVSSAIAELN